MQRRTSAFTLVEMSIALVIVGLLVGGILSGKSLIRASELRSVVTEYMRFTTATQSFVEKYRAVPGDYEDGIARWGQSTACAGASATGTCNGNGDGVLDQPGAASTNGEIFQFWRQLTLAGLIEGNYTGLSGPNGASDMVIGSNVPPSRMDSGGWGAANVMNGAGLNYSFYAIDMNNVFMFGTTFAGGWVGGNNMTPQELWNIDKKADDGMPATGKIIAYSWSGCTTSTSNTDFTGQYKTISLASLCSAFFLKSIGS